MTRLSHGSCQLKNNNGPAMNNQQEIINTMVLSRINFFHLSEMVELYRKMGSATAVMEHRHDIRSVLPDASDRLAETLAGNIDAQLRRAEDEMEFISKHHIQALTFNDPDYPSRLRECCDAPIILYYLGNAPLNQPKVIDIVGTRHCTAYGVDLVRRFLADLHRLCPHTLVVSGLAYGIDINAHRNALQQGMETVAVLAHGLDDLYPPRHRQTAEQMVHQGGLITEFMSHTNADKINFVRRNRIVAGMSDATILVESAAKGGGLITCKIANSYNKDVFAFPGAVGANYSEGCNMLIRSSQATLITSASDFVKSMNWEDDAKLEKARKKGIERTIFPVLTNEEQLVVDVLKDTNDLQTNMLLVRTPLSISQLTSVVFQLEMKGVVKMLAGGVCHLLA